MNCFPSSNFSELLKHTKIHKDYERSIILTDCPYFRDRSEQYQPLSYKQHEVLILSVLEHLDTPRPNPRPSFNQFKHNLPV